MAESELTMKLLKVKSLVNQYALVSAYTQRGGIHKIDTGTNAQQDFLFRFHKTVMGHTSWKEMRQMLAYRLLTKTIQVLINIHLADMVAQPLHLSITHSCSSLSSLLLSHLFFCTAFSNHQRKGDKGVIGYALRTVWIVKNAIPCHEPQEERGGNALVAVTE